ncbi:hypothetical protein JCM33374_g4893 [Metschnikowia sp. JCM 33374]|nr:hypothetical protein JCM33374_g4893 [Metschnikowia sp. JCM 33374]
MYETPALDVSSAEVPLNPSEHADNPIHVRFYWPDVHAGRVTIIDQHQRQVAPASENDQDDISKFFPGSAQRAVDSRCHSCPAPGQKVRADLESIDHTDTVDQAVDRLLSGDEVELPEEALNRIIEPYRGFHPEIMTNSSFVTGGRF